MNPQEKKEYDRKRYIRMKDIILEKKKLYRENNKNKIIEYRIKYYENNRNKIIKESKKYYKDNKDKVIERGKKYKKNNEVRWKYKVRIETKRKFITDKECAICKGADNLQTHHFRYRSPVQRKDFSTLCINCHNIQHLKYPRELI